MLDAYDQDAPEELRKLRKKIDSKKGPAILELEEDVLFLLKRCNELDYRLSNHTNISSKVTEMMSRVIALETQLLVVAEFKQDYFLLKKLLLMSAALNTVLTDNLATLNVERCANRLPLKSLEITKDVSEEESGLKRCVYCNSTFTEGNLFCSEECLDKCIAGMHLDENSQEGVKE